MDTWKRELTEKDPQGNKKWWSWKWDLDLIQIVIEGIADPGNGEPTTMLETGVEWRELNINEDSGCDEKDDLPGDVTMQITYFTWKELSGISQHGKHKG